MAEQPLWILLAPTEKGRELQFEGLERRASSGAAKKALKRPSRPITALKDSTGRSVVFGYEKFHSATQRKVDELEEAAFLTGAKVQDPEGSNVDCPRVNGMLHGRGTKEYEVIRRWRGTLLPYGVMMRPNAPPNTAPVIPYERYNAEPGVLQKFHKPIILVHGKEAVKSVLHCAMILEKLKFSNNKATAIIMEFEDVNTQRNAFVQAKFSALYEHFAFPIIAVLKKDFEFSKKQMLWPHPRLIQTRKERLDEKIIEQQGWSLPYEHDAPADLSISALGDHRLDEFGRFPTEIDLEKAPQALVCWAGCEIYAGYFHNGSKHGEGLYARANGDLLHGFFHRGTTHGACTYYYRSGNMFLGEWVFGKQIGEGEVRTTVMQAAALDVQTCFRAFLARRLVEKVRQAEQVRKKAMAKARKLAAMEEVQLMRDWDRALMKSGGSGKFSGMSSGYSSGGGGGSAHPRSGPSTPAYSDGRPVSSQHDASSLYAGELGQSGMLQLHNAALAPLAFADPEPQGTPDKAYNNKARK